jgi:hypothetical protein
MGVADVSSDSGAMFFSVLLPLEEDGTSRRVRQLDAAREEEVHAAPG